MLGNGEVIIGMPRGSSDRMAHHVRLSLLEWLALPEPRPQLMVFPFPVDVVDLRKK
jgi:hypothetical protein